MVWLRQQEPSSNRIPAGPSARSHVAYVALVLYLALFLGAVAAPVPAAAAVPRDPSTGSEDASPYVGSADAAEHRAGERDSAESDSAAGDSAEPGSNASGAPAQEQETDSTVYPSRLPAEDQETDSSTDDGAKCQSEPPSCSQEEETDSSGSLGQSPSGTQQGGDGAGSDSEESGSECKGNWFKRKACEKVREVTKRARDAREFVGRHANSIAHGALDVAGFVPVVGGAADLLNAGIYLAQGDRANAALAAVAAVPGVGDAAKAAVMAAKGAKVATGGVVATKAAKGIVGTEVVQRAMSRAELKATRNTHLVRGGRPGTHYATDSANSKALRARQRLALPQTPEVIVDLEVRRGIFGPAARVKRNFGMPGGGLERIATGPVPCQVVGVRSC